MTDLRKLRVFLAVADSGSFTGAAPGLFMSQPAVSQAISQLERELGASLFTRLARGVRLNEAGRFVRARARVILQGVADLEQDLLSFNDGTIRLTIGAFPTAGIELLPKVLGLLKMESPNLRIAVKPLRAADPLSLIREQEADYVLMFDYNLAPRPIDVSLIYEEVDVDPLRVLLPPNHVFARRSTVDLSELASESWVLRSHRAPYERIHEQMFRAAGIRPNSVFWTDDYQSLQGLVAAGVGVSLAPSLATVQHRADIAVLSLGEPVFSRRVQLVTTAERAASDEYQTVLAAMRNAAQCPQPRDL